MKVLITGTHFTTAVATIEEIQKYPDIDIVYVGRKTTREGDSSKSVESEAFPKMGVKFISITAGRLQRAFTIYTIPSLFKIPIGFIQALWILSKEKPDVLLSFGGYVSVPLVIWSWLLSIPVIIHEQTLVTGLSNKISSLFADKVAISFKENHKIGGKFILTGPPLRKEFFSLQPRRLKRKLPTILITCGNQGSHVVNLAVEEVLGELTKIAQIIHQTGDSKFRDFERLEVRQSDQYVVKKWIEGMGFLMKGADLVVSRAGINTLTEMAYLGKPGLVIPIPYLYQDEQTKNAKFFQSISLVKVLPQSRLSGESLLKEIKGILSDLKFWKQKAKTARNVIIPDAGKRLALETILLGK